MTKRKPRSDRGKKRAYYDSTGRRQTKQADDYARQIETLSRLEHARPEGRPCHVRRQEARARLVPRDWKCPFCGTLVLELRRWALKNGPIQCISCRRIALNEAKKKPLCLTNAESIVAPATTGQEVVKQQEE